MKSNIGQDFSKNTSDPFADFSSFASHQKKTETSNSNAFGDFDFDSYSKQPATVSSTNNIETKPQTKTPSNNLLDMGFSETSKTQSIPVNEFQTNTFQTKNPGGFDDFLSSFKQNQTNLMDDENPFSTNAYVNRNHYMELQGWGQSSEKYFGDRITPPIQQPKNKTIKQNLMEYNKMAGLATKKAANTVAMKFNEIKKNINESLI